MYDEGENWFGGCWVQNPLCCIWFMDEGF